MKKYIVFLCIGMTFLSCSKDDNSNEASLVVYNQTYCFDPWGYADNNNELIDRIGDYFKEKNIELSNISIDNKGTQQLCNACTCLSGTRIFAIVDQNDLNSIREYGFQEHD